MQIVIPIKPISWNAIACKHFRVYSKIMNSWRWFTLEALSKVKKEKFTYPVSIHFHAKWKMKKVHDIDDLYGKAVVDQLVASGFLVDDSLEYVRSVTYTGEIGADKDEMIVTIC